MSNFTPGPWKIAQWEQTTSIKANDGVGDVYICNLTQGQGDEGRANARLIASAPELLTALESLIEFAHAALSGTVHADTLQNYEAIARAAIARVKNRQDV